MTISCLGGLMDIDFHIVTKMFDTTPWIKHWIFKRLLCTPANDNAEYSDLRLFQSAFRIWER